MIYDLSGTVFHDAEWFGDPCEPVEIRDIGSLEKDGWVSHVIKMTTISGTTYFETGGHLLSGMHSVDQVPCNELFLDAFIWNCEIRNREIVLSASADIPASLQGKALVLICGWYKEWNSKDFFIKSPYLSTQVQELILALQPSCLVSDAVSFDNPNDADMTFLKAYFKTGGNIVSPICPESPIPSGRGELIIAPLKLSNTNSSPCRVFLKN